MNFTTPLMTHNLLKIMCIAQRVYRVYLTNGIIFFFFNLKIYIKFKNYYFYFKLLSKIQSKTQVPCDDERPHLENNFIRFYQTA